MCTRARLARSSTGPHNNELQQTRPGFAWGLAAELSVMRTNRPYQVMKRSAADWVRVTIALFACVWACGCEYQSPGLAAGVTADSLPQVRRGMTRDDVLRVLGQPLSDSGGSSTYPKRWLTYARSRSLRVGNHHMWQPARECAVVFENDLVSEAYFIDTRANVSCFCRADACDEDWASECVGTLR